MERNEYEVVQYTLLSENQVKILRNTYVAMTMLARLGIKALVSHLLTQIQHVGVVGCWLSGADMAVDSCQC